MLLSKRRNHSKNIATPASHIFWSMERKTKRMSKNSADDAPARRTKNATDPTMVCWISSPASREQKHDSPTPSSNRDKTSTNNQVMVPCDSSQPPVPEDGTEPEAAAASLNLNQAVPPSPPTTTTSIPAAISATCDDHAGEHDLDEEKSKMYQLLGGGKAADILLWREKKVSSGLLGVATAIWVLFELMEYHLLTLVCHILIGTLALLFLWSNASSFIIKSPPEVVLPEHIVVGFASVINRAFAILREIASGSWGSLLLVIALLWVLSIIGRCCNFLTFFYVSFLLLHTVPVLYERYEDRVDSIGEKAGAQFKNQYAVFNEKVLSKIT